MRLVIIESPFAASNEHDAYTHRAYAKRCLIDSILERGEAGFASHLLYPQVLNDRLALERSIGIRAGLAWGVAAELTAVYFDLGISAGMREGIAHAQECGRPIEYRSLEGKVWTE